MGLKLMMCDNLNHLLGGGRHKLKPLILPPLSFFLSTLSLAPLPQTDLLPPQLSIIQSSSYVRRLLSLVPVFQMENPLRITSLNHISIVCRSVEKSLDFYQNLLGFIPIRRPRSFDFDGAWLFNHGMGIHLLQSEDPGSMPPISEINPKDNHISFQCESMANVEKRLKEINIEYVKGRVEEGGIAVDQIFFHDPDGLMIEICDCDNLPMVTLGGEYVGSCSRTNCNVQIQPQIPQASMLNCQRSVASRPSMPSMDYLLFLGA